MKTLRKNIGTLMARLAHILSLMERPMSMLFLSDLPKSNQRSGTDFWKNIVCVTIEAPASFVFKNAGRL